MATPTQKRSKSRKRKKQYRLRLKPLSLSRCPQCKKPILSHRACLFCGTYNNKQILDIELKKEKTKSKKKEDKK